MISGKLYNNMIRQEFYSKLYITSAQLLNTFSTPITIIAGQSGIFYIPKRVHFVKEAGTAYTLNGSTAFGLYYNTVAGQSVGTMSPAGFLDQAGQLTTFINGPNGAVGVIGQMTAANITAANGAPLVFANNTANLTVGTGGLFITVLYEQWPMTIGFS